MNKRFLNKAMMVIGVGMLATTTVFAATVPSECAVEGKGQQVSQFNGNNGNGNGNGNNNGNNGNGNSNNNNNNNNNNNGNGNNNEEKTTIIERATIKDINPNNQRVTILPEGMVDDISNYIALRVNNNKTTIENGEFGDFEEGMEIYVEHSVNMSSSTPPQTDAVTIRIESEVEAPEQEKIVHEGMTILSIDHERGLMEIGRVKQAHEASKVEYVVAIDKDTDVTHYMNEREYTYKDLEKDMIVTVVQEGKTMPTTPPTIKAEQVIITGNSEIEVPELEDVVHENMTILSIDHESGMMEIGVTAELYGAEQVAYRVYIGEDTDVRHYMNEMLYSYKDLEEGMVVTVVQDPITMPSLPPTITAKEVIITGNAEIQVPELEDVVHENMTILSIDHENGMMEIGVTTELYGTEQVAYRVYIGEDTDVRHYMNEMLYSYKDLEEGMVVTVVQEPITMPSVPPTITAKEVIITAENEKEETPELENITHENMVILSIDHEAGMMEIGNAKQAGLETEVAYNVYIGEGTSVRHERNKKAYTYKSLKEGMIVSVTQYPIVQPSAIPTISALEVVISQ